MTQIQTDQWHSLEETNQAGHFFLPSIVVPESYNTAPAFDHVSQLSFEQQLDLLLDNNQPSSPFSETSSPQNPFTPPFLDADLFPGPCFEPTIHLAHPSWSEAPRHTPHTSQYTYDTEGNCYSTAAQAPQQSYNSGSQQNYISFLQEALLASGKRKFFDDVFGPQQRAVRPKVIEGKGSVQCCGTNRKKGIQCRNAALMEYIGPRPQYCAEHIEMDPESLYEKCKSSYQREVGDNKNCKEVVLKEFGVCHKHFHDMVNVITQKKQLQKAVKHLERITILHLQLEEEAAAAKKKDGDLFQRKNKLIPKFAEMKKMMSKAVAVIRERADADDDRAPPLQSPSRAV